MTDDWVCEVKLARSILIKGAFFFLAGGVYSVRTLPIAYEQLVAGSLYPLRFFFLFFSGILALFLTLFHFKWHIRVGAKALELRRSWGWQKFLFAHIELDAAWKKRLANSDEAWAWLHDQSEIVLHFIGGRVVKLPYKSYTPRYELKYGLLKALAAREPGAFDGMDRTIDAWRDHLALPQPFDFENALMRVLPMVVYLLHVILILGIGMIVSVMVSDRIGIALMVIALVPLGYGSIFLEKFLLFAIQKNLRIVGYYLKALTAVSAVVGMCMFVFLNYEKVGGPEWAGPAIISASIVLWLMGAIVYIGGDVLARRGRKAEGNAVQ